MDKLEWDDSLNIDVLDLDEKMQQFFSVLNRFFSFKSIKNKREEDFDDILEVFADLAEYVNSHFRYEEMILSQYSFPEFNKHQKEHKRFIKRMLGYRRLFSDDPERRITMRLNIPENGCLTILKNMMSVMLHLSGFKNI